ncbi:MAG: patatin-like phospholipase family protein [Byssovorax sp.]
MATAGRGAAWKESAGHMNILTIDGGFSAPVQLRLLQKIEAQTPGFLAATDLFSGVSDGASAALYLALMLGKGQSGAEALAGAITFSDALTRTLRATPLGVLRTMCGWGSLMNVNPFQKVLKEYFGETTLGELLQMGKKVAVIAFDLNTSKRKIFGMGDASSSAELDLPLYQINWASGALPLWCPVYATDTGHYFADGGVVDNNPAMAALVAAISYDRGQVGAPKNLAGISLLSLGSTTDIPIVRFADPSSLWDRLLNLVLGSHSPLLEVERPDRPVTWKDSRSWGYKQWMIPNVLSILQLLLTANTSGIDAECKELLGNWYCRYAPIMPMIPTAIDIIFGLTCLAERSYNKQAAELAAQPAFADLSNWVNQCWKTS